MPLTYQASFGGGELAPSLWSRVDLAKYAEGLKTCRNFFIAAHGGAYSRPGLRFVAEAKDSANPVRLIPFQFNTTQTYILEFGHYSLRVHTNGGPVLEAAKAASAVSQTVLSVPGHGYLYGETLFLSGFANTGRTVRIVSATADTITLIAVDGGPLTLSGAGTVARVYTLATPYSGTQVSRLKITQSADVLTLCHPDHPPRDLRRWGHASWGLSDISFAPTISSPQSVSVGTNAVGAVQYSYCVTALSESGEESPPSATVAVQSASLSNTVYATISWAPVAGATGYTVYKYRGGVFGQIGRASGTTFSDDNIAADLSATPPSYTVPFGAGNWPQAVAYYQQRRVYGGSVAKPQTLWMSMSAAYNNFSTSTPSRDDDAITLTIAAGQVNEVRHIVPLSNLIVLTAGAEFTVGPGSQADALTPSNVAVRPQGYRGASHCPPLVVGNTILYVQRQGSIVRDLGYDYTSDSFTGSDLSVLSNHLFLGRQIVDWAYAQTPHSLVWAVRDDGVLLGLTYMREQKVWAWHRHDTDGVFESVATVPEGTEDAVYVVVRRTIGGVQRRFIERFSTRTVTTVQDCFCVDSGLTYSGPPVSAVSGLWHLEGKAVAVLADGNVVTGQTVSGGRITLPQPAAKIHVGLPYVCELRTLDIEMAQVGTIQGRDKRVVALTVRMENTRGLKVGRDGALTEMRVDPFGPSSPIPLETGDYRFALPPGWSTGSSVVLRQDYPLPAAVMAIVPEIDVA